jgi:hypothetical protein
MSGSSQADVNVGEVAGATPTISPPPSSAEPSVQGLLLSMMRQMEGLKADLTKMRLENTDLRKEVHKVTRRQSGLVPESLIPTTPFHSPPKLSSMTHSAVASFQGSPTIQHFTRVKGTREQEEDDDELEDLDELKDSEVKEMESPSQAAGMGRLHARRGHCQVDEEKEAKLLAKILSKREKPDKFGGQTDKERDEVETWVNDVSAYLDSQFGQLADRDKYWKLELDMAMSFMKDTARRWAEAYCESFPSMPWAVFKVHFTAFILGGRESRSLWVEKMHALKYGTGSCKNLLGLEREFEALRVKLYPTSSADPAMNEVVGREYSEAIKRGKPHLYVEMLRILGGKDRPTLSEWKMAAAKAVQIQEVTSTTMRGEGRSQRGRWDQNRFAALSVNEMDTDQESGRDEGEAQEPGDTEGQPSVSVQQMNGRQASSRGKKTQKPQLLTPEQYRQCVEEDRCFQCYKTGHHIGDDACPEKGKKKRKPAAGELKV